VVVVWITADPPSRLPHPCRPNPDPRLQHIQEDWFSFCTDITGATLNTQGEREDYNYQALKMVEPSLKSLVIEDFQFQDDTRLDLLVEPSIIKDDEILNDILLSGSGEVTIEPL